MTRKKMEIISLVSAVVLFATIQGFLITMAITYSTRPLTSTLLFLALFSPIYYNLVKTFRFLPYQWRVFQVQKFNETKYVVQQKTLFGTWKDVTDKKTGTEKLFSHEEAQKYIKENKEYWYKEV